MKLLMKAIILAAVSHFSISCMTQQVTLIEKARKHISPLKRNGAVIAATAYCLYACSDLIYSFVQVSDNPDSCLGSDLFYGLFSGSTAIIALVPAFGGWYFARQCDKALDQCRQTLNSNKNASIPLGNMNISER